MPLRKTLTAISVVAALTGCDAGSYEPTNSFDPSEVAFAGRPGSANVSGQAFLRQRGGVVVTCAGAPVFMIPASKYTDEIFTKALGGKTEGVAGAFAASPSTLDTRLRPFSRTSQCDASGNFNFSGISAGTYWMAAQVKWTVGNNIFPEGGLVIKRVGLPGRGSSTVLLTQNS